MASARKRLAGHRRAGHRQADDAVARGASVTERRYRRRDPNPLHGHPRHRPSGRRFAEAVQEALAARGRQGRQRPRRDHDRQGARGHPGERAGQQFGGVTVQQLRRGRRRQRDPRLEPRGPLWLTRPQAGAQPSGLSRVGHVERIGADADPGDDLRHRPRREGPVSRDRRRQLHGRRRVTQRLPVAVRDAHAVGAEVEPSRTAHVDQPGRIRAEPPRRLGNGRVQHGASHGLVGPHRPAHGDGHHRTGHPQQRADRRAGGRVAVRRGVGRGQLRGAPGECEVMQRGEDHRGMPLAGRRRLDGAQRLAGFAQGDGDALVQR